MDFSHENLIEEIKKNIIQGRRNKEDEGLEEELYGMPGVEELVKEALTQGVDVKDILTDAVNGGMQLVGEKYSRNEYYIPDMLAAAEAVGMAMDILAPYLKSMDNSEVKGKFVLATVEKDQHDIGKNIVGIMLKGAGFQVIDLGTDVPAGRIIQAVEEEKAEFIGFLLFWIQRCAPWLKPFVCWRKKSCGVG